MHRSSVLVVVWLIATRNLIASRSKTLIVGGIIAFGACLFVVGRSMLDAIDRSVGSSVTDSIVGEIQVYSSRSKDALEVMGGFGETPDLDPLADFARVKAALQTVPGVAQVVPMGISAAMAYSGTSIEKALADLRASAGKRAEKPGAAAIEREYAGRKARVQHVLSALGDMTKARRIADARNADDEDAAALQRASSAQFWASFDADPYQHLEFLENRVAPLMGDADLLYLPYLGTDPDAFARSFKRLTIVDGQAIPPGQRGFLFSKQVYEEQVKLKAARGFDRLKQAIDLGSKIASDRELQRLVRLNAASVGELLMQLDPHATQAVRDALQAFLHSAEPDAARLLASFFNVDDGNVAERYRFFYAELAPRLDLYRIRVGDTLSIASVARGGYVHSANLKVYGTFAFQGLERSPQAGLLNMMDLVSFRELYGFTSEERAREIEALRARSNVREVAREDVESELFGASARAERQEALAKSALEHTPAPASALASVAGVQRGASGAYDPQQLEQGAVLNAAVRLRADAGVEETIRAIEAAGRRAGLPLKAVPWQAAAGVFGQFVLVTRWVLLAALLIIVSVALVIVNNALVIAALERVRELGMLRAIGAQRRFLLGLLFSESLLLGVLAGGLGAGAGAALMALLGRTGISARNEAMLFFFSGPRLYPAVQLSNVAGAVLSVLVVSAIAGFYPVWFATRVSPREAMFAEE